MLYCLMVGCPGNVSVTREDLVRRLQGYGPALSARLGVEVVFR